METEQKSSSFSFDSALKIARKILFSSSFLTQRDLINTESEQIIMAAYRSVSGEKLTRLDLFSKSDWEFPKDAMNQVVEIASARAEGRPLQHLTGTQIFLDHEYGVGPDVLVPRPETEILVSRAILELEKLPFIPELGFEIGLGSGVLSIELLSHFKDLQMVASELTEEAQTRAISNAHRILGDGPQGIERIQVIQALDAMAVWEPFKTSLAIKGKADFIISNPPYLTHKDPIESDVFTHEPATALFAPEEDPLYFYRMIALGAPDFLHPGGIAFLEVPSARAQMIADLFEKNSWEAEIVPDLNQRERVLIAKLNFSFYSSKLHPSHSDKM